MGMADAVICGGILSARPLSSGSGFISNRRSMIRGHLQGNARRSLIKARKQYLQRDHPAEPIAIPFDPLRYCRQIERFWQRPRRWAPVVFGIVLLGMVSARSSMVLYGMWYCCHDAFLVMDGAWRMAYGQRPHVDFNSMLGPAAYLPTLIGLRLTSNIVEGFAFGQALVGAVLGIWGYLMGSALCDLARCLYALCIAAIAISPGQLGLSPFALTPGMTYNRYCYALLGILLLDILLSERFSRFKQGFSTGAVLGILAFIKFTSFATAVVLLVCLTSMRGTTRSRWLGIVAGFSCIACPFAIYLHFDLIAILRDIALTAAAKHVQLVELYQYNSIAFEAVTGLLFTCLVSFFLFENLQPSLAKRVLRGGVVVIVANVLLLFGNWQQSELPLVALILLILCQLLVDGRAGRTASDSGTPALVIGAATLFAGLTVASAIVGLGSGIWLKTHSAKAASKFRVLALQGFVPVRWDAAYTDFVNDGFILLQQYRRPAERVMSLDFSNPFSCGLAIPPAPGGSTNLQYKGSFDSKHKLSAWRLFGQADLVMVPKSFSDPSLQESIPTIYGPYLESHFHLIGESLQWKLYRRMP